MMSIVHLGLRPNRVVPLFEYAKRFAGHSKWANIKHTKALKDSERARNFNRLRRMMWVAITEGKSANPSTNFKLSQAIEQAKKAHMPVANINNILAAATSPKTQTKAGTFEIRGPGGSIVIAEYYVENIHILKSNVNIILRKTRCALTDSGALHMFTAKGIIEATSDQNIETATDHAIQVNADDVEEIDLEDGKAFLFTCEPRTLYDVRKQLEELKYNILSAEVQYIARQRVTLSEQDLNIVSNLCNRLGELEDITNLYHNIA